MEGYEKECAQVLLEEQERVFGETVANTLDEAIDFLNDCIVLESIFLYLLNRSLHARHLGYFQSNTILINVVVIILVQNIY